MITRILLCLMWTISLCGADSIDWTWLHRQNFNTTARMSNSNKKIVLFENSHVKPFTQLIFSWNAIRPEEGFFSFYVQVRNAETKKWGAWHHMVDWGAQIQQSYLSKSDGFSTFVHVRLEIDNKKLADAFRIKIIPQHKASLSLIYNYAVALSNFNLFKPEQSVETLPSVHIEGVPLIAQFALEHEDNSRICSPVSCTMLVDFLMNKDTDPLDFAAQSFDGGLQVYGSWPCNMAHAFECCNAKMSFCVRRMNSFADVYQHLAKGIPVIVSVRGTLPGALKPFPHGHLLVIVGWDNDTHEVLCHDSAAESHEKVFKRYPVNDFLRAWECSHRLAYVAEPGR